METLTVGGLAFSLSRLAALLGMATTLAVARWLARREPGLAGWGTWALASGVLAARAGYVLGHLDAFLLDPLSALFFWQGGFSLPWGLAGAAGYSLLHFRRRLSRVLFAVVPLAAGLLTWTALSILTAQTTSALERAALPDLRLPPLEGSAANLRDFVARPVVLNLWATWCPPCRREMPLLAEYARAHPEVAFLFVNQGEAAEAIAAFLGSQRLPLDHVLLDRDSDVARYFDTRALPTTLFFAPGGKLAATHLGELSRASLDDYLKRINSKEEP